MALNEQFQKILGRAPTADEAAYFQKFLGEGSIQDHEIGQILQATPEFQQTQLQKNTADFGQKLQAGDERIMQQGADIAGAQATSRFAGLGRPNSSALAASVFSQQGQLAGNLAQSRQSALADFYGRGLQQNMALQQQGGASGLDRAYGQRDETRQFGQQMQLAKYQQDNYNNYLNQANKAQRKKGLGAGIGAAVGTGVGAYFGGPMGAMAGASAGSSLGGGAGGLF